MCIDGVVWKKKPSHKPMSRTNRSLSYRSMRRFDLLNSLPRNIAASAWGAGKHSKKKSVLIIRSIGNNAFRVYTEIPCRTRSSTGLTIYEARFTAWSDHKQLTIDVCSYFHCCTRFFASMCRKYNFFLHILSHMTRAFQRRQKSACRYLQCIN